MIIPLKWVERITKVGTFEDVKVENKNVQKY